MQSIFDVEPSQTRAAAAARALMCDDPGFGKFFTDHMAVAKWDSSSGWRDCRIVPRQPFQLDPAAGVLHYAQEIFEGLKAYRSDDAAVLLFRPEQNARRFNDSARRMAMPELPENLFLDAIESLINIDREWVPARDSGSLYLRPFMFASEAFLGVRPSAEYTFAVIACPVGGYFMGEKTAINLWVSEKLNRAGPGGTGTAKCGGNYAASLLAQREAIENGCDQVIFLDALEHRWIDELGGMNLFFIFDDDRVTTPPLNGTILPGITRASIIELLQARGLDVAEERYSVDQWRADATSGKLCEAFACGTAAVVAPIGEVRGHGGNFLVGNGGAGPLTAFTRERLVNIQRGRSAGPEGWIRKLPSQQSSGADVTSPSS